VPQAERTDRVAAPTITADPEQVWSLLCYSVTVLDDTAELLPDGRLVSGTVRPTSDYPPRPKNEEGCARCARSDPQDRQGRDTQRARSADLVRRRPPILTASEPGTARPQLGDHEYGQEG
jgi:hypothetical protein